ncbi:MAG: AtpZ/AtpI family protein [Deltaproteobacteria bacterium]|nr:AtpZ/AtpI family protein [Deltaproteobacteria bacterium]MBW2393343.1 AtpZ/AtpI family protein [Deltaproteobacteria bacterium]
MKQDQFGQHGQDGRDDGSDGSLPGGGSRAMARASEAVFAIPIGGVIGWALDRWLGTDPWLVMIGLGLGFSVFVRNLFRLRKMVEAEGLAAPQQDEDSAAWLASHNDGDQAAWMTLGNDDDDDDDSPD